MRALFVASVLLLSSIAVFAQTASKEWINSPEAYFASPKEREEWFRLETDAQRTAFVDRYWALRGEQFKQVILARIQRADKEFTISGGDVGSQTARGQVYIVLGPPALAGTRPQSIARVPAPNTAPTGPAGRNEIGDAIVTWHYDTLKNPNLLKMLNHPNFIVSFLVEPIRRSDTLQDPGLFQQFRQLLAEKSIVNPDLYQPIVSTSSIPPVRADARIPDPVLAMLKNAVPATPRTASGIVVSSGDYWGAKGPSAIVSIAIPNAADRIGHLATYGQVRDGDRVVATVAEPFAVSSDAGVANGTSATVLRFDLPPGSYNGSFAIVDDRSPEPLLNVTTPLRISDTKAPFAMSSLLIGSEPRQGLTTAFTFGAMSVQPRADLLFHNNESLWYFATVHSATPLETAKADVQLRRDGKPIAATSLTAHLSSIAPGTYLLGQELPLAGMAAGDYTLYLTLHGAGDASEVRRADFRVIPPR